MNFLKKLKQPLTSGSSSSTTRGNKHHNKHNSDRDLEDDLYDEYVIEAPPHPSELLALGVDPNDPNNSNLDEKLKELYSKSKLEAGGANNNNNNSKILACNSVLLARQRQKEEIEEKKKTREEWKYFDSLTARVQQAVDSTKKTLDHLKESSAIDEINQPDYELKLSADETFKSSATVKQEKEGAENWVDFGDSERKQETEQVVDNKDTCKVKQEKEGEEVDPFGVAPTSHKAAAVPLFDILCETSEPIVPKETDISGPDPFDTSFVKI